MITFYGAPMSSAGRTHSMLTVGDVNAASVVDLAMSVGIPAGPRVTAWTERPRARPGDRSAAKNA